MNDSSALAVTNAGPEPLGRSPAVLVVDDEDDLRELLALTLVRLGLDVDSAGSLAEARHHLARRRYALVLTDMRLPDGMGLDLVKEVTRTLVREAPPIAVITAFGSAENAVAALKAGAFDYLTKPVDLEQLRMLVRSALKADGNAAQQAMPSTQGALGRLIGRTAVMQQLQQMVMRLAHSMAPVAIRGESGSGKELVARAIHESSSRTAGTFVAVNCGAIPESLMEAEFFGYKKGAFTGADRDREGFFQAAAGGTLFLDEVAELPLTMQVKLLRAIQERRVRRVGATTEEAVDVRILSATHQDLGKLVALGRFRQDLYYRLNVIELKVPPLRERAEDIPLIAEGLLQRIASRFGSAAARLAPSAEAALKRYAFPGNVRELENVLERAVALADSQELQLLDLMLPEAGIDLLLDPGPVAEEPAPAEPSTAAPADAPAAAVAPPTFSLVDGIPDNLEAYLDSLEREAIRAALVSTRNNRTAAAQRLGLTFRQLRYRMQRLGLR
jgi:two-component system response regulator PilR (NtrC family)